MPAGWEPQQVRCVGVTWLNPTETVFPSQWLPTRTGWSYRQVRDTQFPVGQAFTNDPENGNELIFAPQWTVRRGSGSTWPLRSCPNYLAMFSCEGVFKLGNTPGCITFLLLCLIPFSPSDHNFSNKHWHVKFCFTLSFLWTPHWEFA